MNAPSIGSLLVWVFVLFVWKMPCAFSDDEWCTDLGDASTACTPTLVDASSEEEDFTANKKITLYCCFLSKESFAVKWYKDNVPVTTGARYQLAENKQVLTIDRAVKSDYGTYRCEGYNKKGRESWNMTVIIHLPLCQQAPKIYSPRATVRVKRGETATLHCIVKTKKDCRVTLPAFYWRNPSGKAIDMTKTKTSISNRTNVVRMTLTIKHARKSQAGPYKCITKNTNDKVSSFIWLKVE